MHPISPYLRHELELLCWHILSLESDMNICWSALSCLACCIHKRIFFREENDMCIAHKFSDKNSLAICLLALLLHYTYNDLTCFSFANHLRRFTDVFVVMLDSNKHHSDARVTLHPSLRTPEDRTITVGQVIKCLGSLIPGIRNEVLHL